MSEMVWSDGCALHNGQEHMADADEGLRKALTGA
jgi:hypothetical protein